jgi:hypothetical protein
MYQPQLRPDQITQLYREAVDQYLQASVEELEQFVRQWRQF